MGFPYGRHSDAHFIGQVPGSDRRYVSLVFVSQLPVFIHPYERAVASRGCIKRTGKAAILFFNGFKNSSHLKSHLFIFDVQRNIMAKKKQEAAGLTGPATELIEVMGRGNTT